MRAVSHSSISYWLNVLAKVSFALVLILAPFRWRIVLWSRPTFPVYPDYTDFLLYASDLALIYNLVFWAGSLILSPRKISPGSGSVWVPLAGLTLAGLVSSFGGQDAVLSGYQFIRLILLFLFYLYIVNEIASPAWILIPVGLQVLLQSVIAIGQSLLQHSVGFLSLGELRLDPEVTGVSIVPVGGIRFLRAYGLADHPNILGGCLALGLTLLLAWMIYTTSKFRWLALIVFLPGLLALIMTFSRSAWLSFFIGSIFIVGFEVFALRWDMVKRAVMLGGVSLLIVVPFLLKNVSLFDSRISASSPAQDAQMQERAYLMRAGSTVFVGHSALGIGLGASPLAMKSRFADFRLDFQPPHFALLAAAMETGVLGATFYLFLMFLPILNFILRRRTFVERPLVIGAFALVFAVTVIGLFDYYTWLNAAGRVWQWLAWGLWSAALTRTA